MELTHSQLRQALLHYVALQRLKRCKEAPFNFVLLQKLMRTNGKIKNLKIKNAPQILGLASLNGKTTAEYEHGKEKRQST